MYERTTFVTSWYKREFKSWFSSSQGFCEDCWVNDDAPDLFWQGVQMPEVQRHQWKLVKEKLLSTDDYVLTVCSSFIVWSGLFCEGCSICPISPFCQMPPFLLLSWLSGLPSSYRIDYTTQWFPRRTEYTNKQRKSQCFNVHTLKGVVALEIFGKPCGPYLWKILGLEEERHNSCIVILRGDTPIRKGNTFIIHELIFGNLLACVTAGKEEMCVLQLDEAVQKESEHIVILTGQIRPWERIPQHVFYLPHRPYRPRTRTGIGDLYTCINKSP